MFCTDILNLYSTFSNNIGKELLLKNIIKIQLHQLCVILLLKIVH